MNYSQFYKKCPLLSYYEDWRMTDRQSKKETMFSSESFAEFLVSAVGKVDLLINGSHEEEEYELDAGDDEYVVPVFFSGDVCLTLSLSGDEKEGYSYTGEFCVTLDDSDLAEIENAAINAGREVDLGGHDTISFDFSSTTKYNSVADAFYAATEQANEIDRNYANEMERKLHELWKSGVFFIDEGDNLSW